MGDNEMDSKELESSMEITFEKRFGWYVVLNRLSDNKINEHDKILDKKIIEALNQLTYLIGLDQEQIKQQKKANGYLA